MKKHHNKLYFGKYTFKTIFKMLWAHTLYPTNDQHLIKHIDGSFGIVGKKHPKVSSLASFIMKNRNKMKFRIQQNITAFYTNEDLEKYLITEYWDEWYGVETVNPKFKRLGKNSVGCKRLPHGKFKYQVHLKKDIHQLISTSDRESLWRLIENNSEHCLVTNKYVLDYLIGKYPYCYHGYFYISEQKMLTPIYMIAQKGIDKVVKFVQIKNGNHKKITR